MATVTAMAENSDETYLKTLDSGILNLGLDAASGFLVSGAG